MYAGPGGATAPFHFDHRVPLPRFGPHPYLSAAISRVPYMVGFSPFDLGGLVAVCWVFVKVLGPVAVAVAKRIEGRSQPQQNVADDPAVYQMQRDVEELQERVDFLERTLAAPPPPRELPQRRTPA